MQLHPPTPVYHPANQTCRPLFRHSVPEKLEPNPKNLHSNIIRQLGYPPAVIFFPAVFKARPLLLKPYPELLNRLPPAFKGSPPVLYANPISFIAMGIANIATSIANIATGIAMIAMGISWIATSVSWIAMVLIYELDQVVEELGIRSLRILTHQTLANL